MKQIKRVSAMCLCLLFGLCALFSNMGAVPSSASVRGDVTGDGTLNMRDVMKLYQHISGLITLPDDQLEVADYDDNDIINMRDCVRWYAIISGTVETTTTTDVITTTTDVITTTTTTATTTATTPSTVVYTVTFTDWDGAVLSTQQVEKGAAATAPDSPVRAGYVFVGWDCDYSCVMSDMTVKALYEDSSTPAIYVENTTISQGQETLSVNVCVRNNPGILGMLMTVYYDEEVMTLTDVSNGSAVSHVLTLTKDRYLTSGCDFSWDGQEIKAAEIKDGAVLALTFDVDPNAAKGVYEINVELGDIYDNDIMPITLAVENGCVTIK